MFTKDHRQMPATDVHFPEERDRRMKEIRSMPKQVTRKSEPPQIVWLLPSESVWGNHVQQMDAEPLSLCGRACLAQAR
jgi:hypothetical protein